MATIRKLKKIAFPTSGGTAVFDSDDFVYSVNGIKPNVADGNVYIDRVNNANHSDAATKVDQKVSANAVTHTAYPTNSTYVPDMSFIAYWNGAYSGTASNLSYCNKGAFGTATTKNIGDFATNTLLTNQNLNNIISPGFYNAGGSNTITNKPNGVDNFGLEVIHHANGPYYTQKLYTNTNRTLQFLFK